ncbi:MAG: DUF3623 domain-containing protein [Proteobacteria bacterium]|nr:MAG: DUF3623 domain-containing protein [Pseudomonadota bacterium]
MADLPAPIAFTAFAWWFLTGLILWLDRRPVSTFRLSFVVATVVLGGAIAGLVASAEVSSPSGHYVAFASALLVWGWIETAFLFGFITGPRTTGCAAGCHGWRHFVHAVQAILYHELTMLFAAGAIAVLTVGAANRLALWTFLLLWVLRQSAKLNLFFGVPNVGDGLLPPHLAYLATFFRRRPMNALFPFSLTAATVLTVLLAQRALDEAATPGMAVGWALLATLSGLATLEHWFMVLPIRSEALWSVSLGEPAQPVKRASCPPL